MNRFAMTRCLCGMLVALAAFAASAEEMWYKGDLPGGITNAQNYCKTTRLQPTERYDRLPGANDEICIVGSGVTIDIDDGHFDFLKTIGGINLKNSQNFTCNVDIERDQTFGCWIADYSGYGSWRTGWLVKTGSGNLHMATNLTTTSAMRMSYDVQEGDVYLPAPAGGTSVASNLRIAENCTVHAPSNTKVIVSSLAGAGTFTNDATESAPKNTDLYIGGEANENEPTVFSGRLRGKWYVVNLNGYTYFTGTENDFSGAVRGYSSKAASLNDARAVGFVSYPESGVSSLGTSTTIDNREGLLRLRYLGTAPVTAGRKITVNDTTVGPTTIDGGLWGGLTWQATFALVTTDGSTAVGKQQRVAFTGTNAGERCYFTGQFQRQTKNGTNYSFHVTKDGPGTWRFLQNASSGWRGAVTVRDGTLEFDSIAETNKNCALGYATECYPDVCDYIPNMVWTNKWAWRLGDASDSSATGSLKYVGTKDMHLESRKTALAGAGRFRFGEGSLFKYSAGISGLGAGEKTMCFESEAGATNVIAEISDGEGTVSVVKEGAGKTVLTGNLGFSGDLRVEGGELVLKDINNADYRHYRINFKENVSTSTHPGLEEYRAKFPTVQRAIKVASFGLYNDSGTQQFTNLGSTNISYLALEPGQGQLQNFGDMTLAYNSKYGLLGGVTRLFGTYDTANCSAGTVFMPQWRSSSRKPVPSDPDTWYRVYLHLSDTATTPVLWDMCYESHTNDANWAMNVTALSIDASADGVSWQEVAATNNIVHHNWAAHCWLSNPPTTEWSSSQTNYPERKSHPNKFPLSATKQQGTYARPAPRSVYVRNGATLRNESASAISVSGLRVDASGMGTLEGFSFDEDGVLTVEGLGPETTANSVTISAAVGGVPGYENLSGWELSISGVSPTRYRISGVTASGITIARRGTFLIVR